MENANRELSLSEGFLEAFGRKRQEIGNYDRRGMENFRQKGTWKHSIMPGTIGDI